MYWIASIEELESLSQVPPSDLSKVDSVVCCVVVFCYTERTSSDGGSEL